MSRSTEEINKIEKAFIGKTIIKVDADSSWFTFHFSDGTSISLETDVNGEHDSDRPAKIYLEEYK